VRPAIHPFRAREAKRPRRMPAGAVVGLLLSTALLLSMGSVGSKATVPVDPVVSAVRSSGLPESRQLAGFFDAEVPGRLESDHVPGATISVVGDGRTLFSKGYGVAEVERRTAFDPATSLVRIASISKLFTWTAVMQQVQAGKLDLHQDVNRYLTSFKIPDTFTRPITLGDLMTHSAGFEERTIGVGARRKADVPPLGRYLAEHLPARVRPPGQVSAYSNYGAALAGYIVSQVSGQPYEQYVQDQILTPLAMRHSTAFEPVPEPLAADQAHSYDYQDGGYQRRPFMFDKLVPDGSISATADDMARFMIAHLQDGRLGDTRVLDESTAQLMHRRSFSADPRIDGYAHGFKERTINGHRVIMHDGAWEGFRSALVLVPDQEFGLFISMNSVNGVEAATALMDAFFDRFLPTPTADSASGSGSASGSASVSASGSASESAALSGFYQQARRSTSTIEKLLTLTGQARLRFTDDGKLVFSGKTWVPIGPKLYQQAGGTERAAFVTPEGARPFLATDGPAYERVPRLETVTFNLVVLLVFVLLALTAVIGLPLAVAVRRLRKRPSSAPRIWRRARWFTGLGAAIGLIFLVLLGAVLAGDTSEFTYGAPAGFQVLLVLPLVFAVLTIAALITTAAAWRQGPVGVLVRSHQLLLLVALLAMAWFCLQWNLVGWRFG
jgi:CubicO group peptidase (beta-lactamase class C family)